MIQVTVDSIRVNLMNPSPERVLLLKEMGQERQLPIFIYATEADAIIWELQGHKQPRPLTHDLLKNCIAELGGELEYILISELRDNIFFAVLHVVQGHRVLDIDARPSDSIALAVRAHVPIYVAEQVLDQAGIYPGQEIAPDTEEMDIFRNFVDTLDMDGLGDQ